MLGVIAYRSRSLYSVVVVLLLEIDILEEALFIILGVVVVIVVVHCHYHHGLVHSCPVGHCGCLRVHLLPQFVEHVHAGIVVGHPDQEFRGLRRS